MLKVLSFLLFGFCVFVGSANAVTLPTTNYVTIIKQVLSDRIDVKANDADVVHIDGTETIKGDKSFAGALTLASELDAANNSNQVATTAWTIERVDDAKGVVPLGETPSGWTRIWIDE